ncbi:sulfatase-like hydrolase/transferase [Thalassotalea atypica]|uniref:sulfatase-like hydrolase/transferase n=1 Tax=Thalassotalea atypica TaxID=2054316 RepID=UPI0025740D98|nr:sulfatase-like hydrolase/transferase [Thalassotalea atypica]
MINLRDYSLKYIVLILVNIVACSSVAKEIEKEDVVSIGNVRPNVILVMSDDQGWGDVSYNGNKILKTPHLDAMAEAGVQMDRFYAAAPVCSPTRGSVLTGRHPFRLGIPWAGKGHMPSRESTLAEVLKDSGYRTGHFGKWHLGQLSKAVKQGYFPGDLADPKRYSPPWENGFEVSFSTESMMPTYNPYYHIGGNFGSPDYRKLQSEPVAKGQKTGGFRWRDFFWTGPGKIVDQWLEGDIAEIVMDQALTFIEEKSKSSEPFLAVIWLHTPHSPLVAGNEDRFPYAEHPIQAQHFYGAVSAMDRQIGRMRDNLQELGISDNTIVMFNSDNGPSYIQNYNSAGHFSGKKGTLKEGGIRVPGIIEWPSTLAGGRKILAPISTSDIYPTILAATQTALPKNQLPLDGINVLPLLTGKIMERPSPIAFQSPIRSAGADAVAGSLSYALSDNRYKLASYDNGTTWELYDIIMDPTESKNVVEQFPSIFSSMKSQLLLWVKDSTRDGKSTAEFLKTEQSKLNSDQL